MAAVEPYAADADHFGDPRHRYADLYRSWDCRPDGMVAFRDGSHRDGSHRDSTHRDRTHRDSTHRDEPVSEWDLRSRDIFHRPRCHIDGLAAIGSECEPTDHA